MIRKALIIAAGAGSRLSEAGLKTPKPLQKVAGLPLIKRVILLGKRAGLNHFVIVVGHRRQEIMDVLKKDDLGVILEFIENMEWAKPNGVSVLKAREALKENFILLMADHIFDVENLARLRAAPLGDNDALLAVDYKLGSIFDMDDATKVFTLNNKVVQIGKQITGYNAVDTGMFLCSQRLFNALEAVNKPGGPSLSDGIQYLAAQQKMGTLDIGDGFWQDVDTRDTIKQAEKVLLQKCRKDSDGLISRHLNRHISLFFSRLLMKTNLSANHVTGLTTLVGIMSGVFAAYGDYWRALAGAFLFKLASILDGCDGELSKLKLSDSKMGQWLDTASDNLTYVVFMVGLIIGLASEGQPYIGIIGPLTLFGVFMTLTVMVSYLLKNTNSGSLIAIQKDFQAAPKHHPFHRFIASVQFMMKRDFFALAFLILAVFKGQIIMLWLAMMGTNVTWMVLLSKSLGLFKPTAAPVVIKESQPLGE